MNVIKFIWDVLQSHKKLLKLHCFSFLQMRIILQEVLWLWIEDMDKSTQWLNTSLQKPFISRKLSGNIITWTTLWRRLIVSSSSGVMISESLIVQSSSTSAGMLRTSSSHEEEGNSRRHGKSLRLRYSGIEHSRSESHRNASSSRPSLRIPEKMWSSRRDSSEHDDSTSRDSSSFRSHIWSGGPMRRSWSIFQRSILPSPLHRFHLRSMQLQKSHSNTLSPSWWATSNGSEITPGKVSRYIRKYRNTSQRPMRDSSLSDIRLTQ